MCQCWVALLRRCTKPTTTKCKLHRQIAAPPSGTSGSRAVPAAGARNDDARVAARHEAVPICSSSRAQAKRSPCWHSPSSLLAASGRLGGAASGRYHVVIFTKRNPTKCSRRGYVSVGLRSCVAAPNLRLLNARFTGRLPRRFA